MLDLLTQTVVSNLAVASLIAVVAFVVTRQANRPTLAHLLWLLVLLKLVTPSIWHLPCKIPEAWAAQSQLEVDPLETSELALADGIEPDQVIATPALATPIDWSQLRLLLLTSWAAGSLGLLFVSLTRVWRFHRVLSAHSISECEKTQSIAFSLAQRLGLRTNFRVVLVNANVAPLVWWTGGRPTIVLPTKITKELSQTELEFVLGHELAHICRRDHIVRWLEWLVFVLTWWNPLAWLARKNLRQMEEICCDEFVLCRLKSQPSEYANSILKTLEMLIQPVVRPPAMASQINSGGILERRIKMIISGKVSKSNSRR